jgi:hypothetical protein
VATLPRRVDMDGTTTMGMTATLPTNVAVDTTLLTTIARWNVNSPRSRGTRNMREDEGRDRDPQGNMKLGVRTSMRKRVDTRETARGHVTGEAHFVGLLGIFILHGLAS